jgi:hypothetical protein
MASTLADMAGIVTAFFSSSRSTAAFPAEAITVTPCLSANLVARSSALSSSLSSFVGMKVEPRLMLMTSARAQFSLPGVALGSAAYRMPSITSPKVPVPPLRTLTPMMVAPGATPMVPNPSSWAATIPATCVAWENVPTS